eukprot:COSAG02_NODE_1311_length_13331_cov_1094.258035_4_plen_161_part_00
MSVEGGGGLVDLGSLLPASLGCGHGSSQAGQPGQRCAAEGTHCAEPTQTDYVIHMHPLGTGSSSHRTRLSDTDRVVARSKPSAAAAATELQPWRFPTGSSSGSGLLLPVYSLSCPTWSSSSSSDAGFRSAATANWWCPSTFEPNSTRANLSHRLGWNRVQ